MTGPPSWKSKADNSNNSAYIGRYAEFLESINKIKNIPKDTFLVSSDVVELHPNIPYEDGLHICFQFLEKVQVKLFFLTVCPITGTDFKEKLLVI